MAVDNLVSTITGAYVSQTEIDVKTVTVSGECGQGTSAATHVSKGWVSSRGSADTEGDVFQPEGA